MTRREAIFGLALFTVIIASHILFQNQLISFVIAPLVLAIWFAMLPSPPEWGIVVLIVAAELLSATPPGALTLALLLPLATRLLPKPLEVRFSLSFLLLIFVITFLQLAILLAFMAFELGHVVIPWPGTLYSLLGSALAAFLVCVIWYEFVVGYTGRRR